MIFMHELRKLLNSRFVIVSLLILLALNGIVAARQAKQTEESNICSVKVLSRIYEDHYNDPEEIDAYYDELTAYKKSQAKVKKEAGQAGIEFIETRQSIWTDGLYTDDLTIIEEMREYAFSCSNYPNEVAKYIANAETNKNEFLKAGYSSDSFEVKNQETAGILYRNVQEKVVLKPLLVNGWEDFYSFSLAGIIAVLMSIIIGSVAFVNEKETGMLPIVKTTRKGRIETVVSKVAAVVICSAVVAIVFSLEALAVFSMMEGVQGGTEPVQALKLFRKSSLIISIRDFLPVILVQRVAAACLMSLTAALTSVIFYNYILSFAVSASLMGVNLALFAAGSDNQQRVVRYLNTYSLCDGVRLFSRYNALNVFGNAVPYNISFAVIIGILIPAIAVVAVLLFCRAGTGIEIAVLKRLRLLIIRCFKKTRNGRAVESKGSILSQDTSLVGQEAFKLLWASRLGPVALVIVIAGVLLFYNTLPVLDQYSYTEKLYYKYISEYAGEWTEEKHTRISELKERYEAAISDHSMMLQKREQGQITTAEFEEHNREYVIAKREIDAVSMLFDHSRYLKKQTEKTGVTVSFLDDRGWSQYLFRTPDYSLLIAILILLSGCFPVEYGIKPMSIIMHPTSKGRNPVFMSKLINVIWISVVLRLIGELPALAILSRGLGMPMADAASMSIEKLSDLDCDISLAKLTCMIFAVRLLAAVALGLLVMAFSCLTRKSFAAIVAASSVVLLPAICDYSGMNIWSKVDFLRLFEGGRLVLDSIAKEGDPDFGLVVFVCIVISAIAVVLSVMSNRRFCRKS